MLEGTAIGNVGRDMEVRFLTDGTPIGKFSLACNEKRTKNGVVEETTTWVSVSVFGPRAEKLAEYIKKGTALYVRGPLKVTQYDSTKEGVTEKRIDIQITGDKVEFMGKSDGAGGGQWAGTTKERPVFGGGEKPAPFGDAFSTPPKEPGFAPKHEEPDNAPPF